MSKMKKVTKNNLLQLVTMMKEYEKKPNQELLQQINSYVDNVINKDNHYFSKLSSYDFDNETLKYLL